MRIEVITNADATPKEKGDQLEDLASNLLRAQSFDVKQRVRLTACELDLLCEHRVAGKTLYYGRGCDNCNKTGYRGRTAIDEIMKITRNLRESIIERKSTDVIRAEAQAGGMRTLRDSGLLKIFDGLTTIEEVTKQTLTFE